MFYPNCSLEMMNAVRSDSLRAFAAADRSGVVRLRAADDAARKTARWLLGHKQLAPTPSPVSGVMQQQ